MLKNWFDENVRSVIEFLPYPILVAEVSDEHIRHVYVNEGFRQEIGYALDEIPTIKEWFEKAYPDEGYRKEVAEHWGVMYQKAKASGEKFVSGNARVNTKSNGKIWYEIKASVGFQVDIVAFVNIAKHVVKEEELRLQIANQSRVLAVLSHDMRAPLVNFLSIAYLSGTRKINSQETSLLFDKATTNAREVLNMVDSTIFWARENFPVISTKKDSFSPATIVKKYLSVLSPNIDEKNLSILFNYSSEFLVENDVSLIEILIRNIISNAFKFSKHSGQVHVLIEQTVNSWTFKVIDEGCGIPPEQLEQINRGEVVEKSRQGFGLGLKLCKDICVRIGANMRIKSKQNFGTTVMITFQTRANQPQDTVE